MSIFLSRIACLAVAGCCSLSVVFSTLNSAANEAKSLLAQAEETVESSPASNTLVDVAGGNESFETLVTAVEAAGLAETLSEDGPFTILAPPDTAFEELPDGALEILLKPENKDLLTDILTYHVIPKEMKFNEFRNGGLATLNGGLAIKLTSDRIIINNASITQADVVADNGIIQVISRVLLPVGAAERLQTLLAEDTAAAPVPAQPATTIVETRSGNGATEESSTGETSGAVPVRGLW